MKIKGKSEQPAVRIERWTLERFDRDTGMVRIEIVPMRPDALTEKLFKRLQTNGLETGMDKLSLWDIRRIRIQRMSMGRFTGMIGVRNEEKDALSENMVFWVILLDKHKKKMQVYHATRAARENTKELYRKAALNEEGKNERE